MPVKLVHINTAYLRNKTKHGQTKMLVSIYNVPSKRWPTFRDLWPRNGWRNIRLPLRCNHQSCNISSLLCFGKCVIQSPVDNLNVWFFTRYKFIHIHINFHSTFLRSSISAHAFFVCSEVFLQRKQSFDIMWMLINWLSMVLISMLLKYVWFT